MSDLRLPLLGVGAWLGGLGAAFLPGWAALLLAVAALATALGTRSRPLVAGSLAGLAVLGVATLRVAAVDLGPVADLVAGRAVVDARVDISSDPRVVPGRFGDIVVVRGVLTRVSGRGAAYALRAPVVVLADESWLDLRLGRSVAVTGRLAPDDGRGRTVLGVLAVRGPPVVETGPDVWWRGAAAVRRSIRDAVAPRGEHARELVPSLVVGDDSGLDPEVADDFRTTGLTHLLAVSGTNLTLLVGFVLIVGRWCGLRGRWMYAAAGLGIVGFVLIARTEPSVVRAAAMGTVALIGMGSNGTERGARCLGAAVFALLLVDPALAVTAGFALSVLATGGILFLAPPWRDAMNRWLPRWAAEAVSVPLAAQVACTPVVTAISGQVSLVAVVANLLAAPAVAPATVLGLAGGLVGLVWAPLGQLVAAPAAWSVSWIVVVAQHGAALPTAAVEWGTGPVSLLAITVLCVLLVVAAPRMLRSPVTGIGCSVLLVVTVLTRPPTLGWPPDGWVMAMCDVGQGDGLVLNAGAGAGVVVDAGPDPEPIDRCLDRLGITHVPLLVLTHFHADHIDGLPGVLDGRSVGEVAVTSMVDPPQGAAAVDRALPAPSVVAAHGLTRRVGEVTVQTLWPLPDAPTAGIGDGSFANDASVVLLAAVQGVRVLLTGDLEPPGQLALRRTVPDLRVDVLKVPHHGSRHQDLDFLTGVQARLALVSVGEGNDYGHPATDVLAALTATGAEVRRTDLDGDVLVLRTEDGIAVRARD
ncbi:MAG: DNA internalization-related competence protein ComEC/Rec2 [uncultured Nocardioides sp.]|uniref:DNA internalization-related competence protein ComEC/Rec2 n=1 Tax=uncultured Nocardioides sp. TaxID=198441 RepID=A0A6J4P1H3_9ACTN|nr:MAG: DNA internalization-related competence protein ComEC/Rec2 [uncultured Nocardioides sp.]